MALTGLQIQKLLPGTNCKECGSNTCLAFAMKLASKKADLSECPYASDEAKQVLGEASEPPVKSVKLGKESDLVLGEETVLYRHEKTFVNQPLLAVNINDTADDSVISDILKKIKEYTFERVGETFSIDMVSVTQAGTDSARFTAIAEKAWKETGKPLVLRSADPSALKGAAEQLKGSGSILCPSEPQDADVLAEAAQAAGHALAVSSDDIDLIIEKTSKFRDSGFTNILLNFKARSLSEQFQLNTIARRAAIKESFKHFGYPFLRFIETGSIMDDTVEAVTEITRYGGVIVLPSFEPAQLASLMTLRLNIYTDPQNPIQVEPKIYEIGDPTPESPVFVTTNFSLTYFVVSGEIENSGISAWLLVPECEGMSVLTAWAAGKFNADSIARFAKEQGLDEKLEKKEIIIPGYVSQLSGELEDNLPGWKVTIGPQEAADIESFVKQYSAG